MYEIARLLNITPTKARNLLFQWQLRNSSDAQKLEERLREALQEVKFGKEGKYIVFGIESPIVREELRFRLKKLGIYADASFSSEIVRLSVEHFVEFLDGFLDEETKDKMHKALIRGGHVKDTSFKAATIRAIKGLAVKAIGPAGDELVGFVQQLFAGDEQALCNVEAHSNPEEQ